MSEVLAASLPRDADRARRVRPRWPVPLPTQTEHPAGARVCIRRRGLPVAAAHGTSQYPSRTRTPPRSRRSTDSSPDTYRTHGGRCTERSRMAWPPRRRTVRRSLSRRMRRRRAPDRCRYSAYTACPRPPRCTRPRRCMSRRTNAQYRIARADRRRAARACSCRGAQAAHTSDTHRRTRCRSRHPPRRSSSCTRSARDTVTRSVVGRCHGPPAAEVSRLGCESSRSHPRRRSQSRPRRHLYQRRSRHPEPAQRRPGSRTCPRHTRSRTHSRRSSCSSTRTLPTRRRSRGRTRARS